MPSKAVSARQVDIYQMLECHAINATFARQAIGDLAKIDIFTIIQNPLLSSAVLKTYALN